MNTAPRPPPAVSFEARIVLRPRSLDETLDLALAYFRAAGRDLLEPTLVLVAVASALVFGVCLAFDLSARWAVAGAFWIAPFLERIITVFGGRHLFKNEARIMEAVGVVLRRSPGIALGSVLVSLPWTPVLVLDSNEHFWVGMALVLGMFWPLVLATEVHGREVSLLERLPFFRAGARARALVNYRFVRALGLILTGTVIRLAVAVGTALLVEFVLGFIFQFQEVTELRPWTAVIGYLAAAPYVALVRLFDYIDARTVREGWDIQVRFNAVAQASESEASSRASRPAPGQPRATA